MFLRIDYLIFSGLLISTNSINSQNLINNSGFDEYFNYVDTNYVLVYHPSYWYYVDSILNHPIYFSTDRYLNKSFKWNIHPDSTLINRGQIVNYISVLILPNTQRAYTALREPLKQGRKYQFSIDIKAFNQSNYFSDLLVGFKDCIDDNMDSSLYQLRLYLPDSLCNEMLYSEWITLTTEFIATGLEKVLLITSGSVNDYMQIINSDKEKFLIMRYQGPPKLKYYIDNICLTEKGIDINTTFAEEFDTLENGEKIILKNIYFDFDKYVLHEKSFPEIERIFNYLYKNENIKILISGHTDNFGSDEYNNILSYKRALSIVEYLTNRGISEDRLQAKGFGEKSPIESNVTSIGRQKNRRIELQILIK